MVEQNIKSVNFKANVSVFVASRVRGGYLRLVSNTCFNHHILYTVKYLVIVNSILLKIVAKLHQIPFRGILVALSFNIVISFFIDRIVG